MDTPGRELPDGSVIFRRPDGDLITRPDRSQIFDDRPASLLCSTRVVV